MPLTAGARLGPYEIATALGAGGMGEVYRATDTRLGRTVAIKILPAEVVSDPDRLARFEREAKAVSALNHPNIVTLHEVGTSDAGPYLVLEKIEGRSLREVLAAGPLPIRRILTFAAQIAEGVAKAHAAGIVHRDLKPDNIMVTEDGFAKVLDFGLAKLVWSELGATPIEETTLVKRTEAGVILWTLGYLSPEQALGKPADYRADQFALGALMYEMATRERPFKRATMLESLSATIRDEPEPIRSKRPDVPAPLEWMTERCLAKDPNDRYASTSDLARDLAAMRDRLSDLNQLPANEAPRRRRMVPRLLRWAIAAVILVGVGIGSYAWGSRASGASAPVSVPWSMPSYRALTFERGVVTGARFGSDGKTVYYSMAVGDGPSRVYRTRIDRAESTMLQHIPPGFLLAVSSTDDLLVLLTEERQQYYSSGVLARVSAMRGPPRPLQENVFHGDWSSDGGQIMIRSRGCQFPMGQRFGGPCDRVSPDGKHIAGGDSNTRSLIIRSADGDEVRRFDAGYVFGSAWSGDGREVWFSASENTSGHDLALYAVTLTGDRRLIARTPDPLTIQDVSSDGRSALIVTGAGLWNINAAIQGPPKERPLDHLGRTEARGLSADGKWVLMNEVREEGLGTFVRSTDGVQTIQLGNEIGRGLSPNGAWALVQTRDEEPRLKLVPVGAGKERDLALDQELSALKDYIARWSHDGRRLFVPLRTKKDGSVRVYMSEDAGPFNAVTGEIARQPLGHFVVSPSGQTVAAQDRNYVVTLYPVDGRAPRALEGERGRPVHWSADERELFLVPDPGYSFRARIYRRELASSRSQLWRTLAPDDLTGVIIIQRIFFADDGISYVYQYSRKSSELFLTYNLR